QDWPIWFRPDLIAPDSGAEGPFPSIYPITKDGRIFMVPTPGQSEGHMSVVVRGPDLTYFLAGDATYSEANLRAEKADGVTNDPRRSIATLRAIKEFASKESTIVFAGTRPRWADPACQPHNLYLNVRRFKGGQRQRRPTRPLWVKSPGFSPLRMRSA